MPGEAFEVAVGALRQEAQVWASQAAQMTALAGRAQAQNISGLQGGIFIAMVNAHNKVCTKVATMCASGGKAFTEVGGALTAAAATYEQEDRAGAHKYRNLY